MIYYYLKCNKLGFNSSLNDQSFLRNFRCFNVNIKIMMIWNKWMRKDDDDHKYYLKCSSYLNQNLLNWINIKSHIQISLHFKELWYSYFLIYLPDFYPINVKLKKKIKKIPTLEKNYTHKVNPTYHSLELNPMYFTVLELFRYLLLCNSRYSNQHT